MFEKGSVHFILYYEMLVNFLLGYLFRPFNNNSDANNITAFKQASVTSNQSIGNKFELYFLDQRKCNFFFFGVNKKTPNCGMQDHCENI
jgi:hypothetical protein